MINAYIGLGSNLDGPIEHLLSAFCDLEQLPGTRLIARSQLYGSSPVGPQDQPDYVNAVAQLETELAPHDLLDQLQAIENRHQRVRKVHWGARTLDLDLLLYGDKIIDTERLQVPHPFMTERGFVLYPLADINATLTLPDGTRLTEWLAQCPRDGLWPLNEADAADHDQN